MPEPSDREWRELVEVLGEVADSGAVTDERVKEIEEEEGNPENPAEDEAAKVAESEEEKKPFRVFYSKEEEQKAYDEAFASRFARIEADNERKRADAEAKAKKEALKEQEDYKQLSATQAEEIEALKADVERLSSVEEKNTTYADTLNTYAEARLNELNLPKGVTKLLESFDPKEKLDWLSENGEDFATDERVLPADQPDESGTPEADEAARGQFATGFARDF